mgnify:CR=1 FL=1
MKRIALLPILVASSLSAASVSDEQAIAKGSAAAAALIQKLGGEVKKNMESSGPFKTVEFCSNHALSMTDQVGAETGTKIKRLTLRERNPINAAAGDEKTLLETWERMVKNAQALPPHELKRDADGKALYYKPLVINNEACLKCHGDIAADSPIGKALHATYPEDRATGYKMGDLRGMIKVEIAE